MIWDDVLSSRGGQHAVVQKILLNCAILHVAEKFRYDSRLDCSQHRIHPLPNNAMRGTEYFPLFWACVASVDFSDNARQAPLRVPLIP